MLFFPEDRFSHPGGFLCPDPGFFRALPLPLFYPIDEPVERLFQILTPRSSTTGDDDCTCWYMHQPHRRPLPIPPLATGTGGEEIGYLALI